MKKVGYFKRLYSYFLFIFIIVIAVWIFKIWPARYFGFEQYNIFSDGQFVEYALSSLLFGSILALWDPLRLKITKSNSGKNIDRKTRKKKNNSDIASQKSQKNAGSSSTAKAALALGAYAAAKTVYPTKMPVIKSSTGATNIQVVHKKKNTWIITFNYYNIGAKAQRLEKKEITPSNGQVAAQDARIELRWNNIK